LTPNVLTQPTAIQWSVRDDEPAYRGQMYQQIESPSDLIGVLSKSKVKREELKKYKALCKDRADLGKPPWASTSLSPPQIATQLQSSRTVRQWCDDYCASAKVLKEFVYTKVCPHFITAFLLQIYLPIGRIWVGFPEIDFRYQLVDC
jgi:hypothetical protein